MGVSIWEGSKAQALIDAINNIGNRQYANSAANIVKAIREGNVANVANGAMFVEQHDYFGDVAFIVRRKNVDKLYEDAEAPTVTIQPKFLLSQNAGTTAKTLQFDRPEAFCKVDDDIAAGTVCKFTLDTTYSSWAAGTYYFTATAAIAAGSLLCINSNASTALTSNKVAVYSSAIATSASATYSIASSGSATKDLGTWAIHPQRVSYGSNNWGDSNIRQFLNGVGLMSSIFTPKHDLDMLSPAMSSLNGFLGGFSEEFQSYLGLAKVHNITNNVFEEDGYTVNSEYYTADKFWLPSRKEIYGTQENANEASEVQLPYYVNVGTTDADKLMYAKGATSPTTWWLRTPNASYAYHVRVSYAPYGGALNNSTANAAYGLAPLAILA